MSEKKFISCHVRITGKNVEILKGLKEMGLSFNHLVNKAVTYYFNNIIEEKLKTILRYYKSMENYSPNMNEEKKE